MKGMMDGWNGDEDEVEYTWEQLDDLEREEADIQNDADWIEDRILV